MCVQLLIAPVEGCTAEPVQTEIDLAGRPGAALCAAPADGLHLVQVFDNCPEGGAVESFPQHAGTSGVATDRMHQTVAN